MPTADTRRMSPLVKRLRDQIGNAKGFSCFSEKVSVEQVIFAHACASGVDVTELLREWTGQPMRQSKAAPKRTPKPKADDDDEPTTRTCPSCDGTGRAKDGGVCPQCDGAGRVDNDPDNDPDEDDD